MEKSRTLISQESLFEGLQKLKFIDGVRGVAQKAIFSILKVLDWVKVQDYSEFLSEGAKANFSVISADTITKYSQSSGSVKSLKLLQAGDVAENKQTESSETFAVVHETELGLFKKTNNKPQIVNLNHGSFSPEPFKKISQKVVKSGKKVNKMGQKPEIMQEFSQ